MSEEDKPENEEEQATDEAATATADGEESAEQETNDEQADGDASPQAQSDDNAKNDEGKVPEFQELDAHRTGGGSRVGLKGFAGVQVTLNAELGRTELTIQELMSLHEGSVVELHRGIGEPVELVAQGVPLGNGEVVVIDERFAIRVKEIYST